MRYETTKHWYYYHYISYIVFIFLPVLTAEQHHCHSALKIPVSADGGHVASQTTAETQCGTRKAPWVLEGQPGQRVLFPLLFYMFNIVAF